MWHVLTHLSCLLLKTWKPLLGNTGETCHQGLFGNKAQRAGPITAISSSAHRIGFAIARRLAQDGAHVVISSRKQENVDEAVTTLKEEGLSVTGTVCHVGKAEDRQHLVTTVRSYRLGQMKRQGSDPSTRESGSLGL